MKSKLGITVVSGAALSLAIVVDLWWNWPRIESAPSFKGLDGSGERTARGSTRLTSGSKAASSASGDDSGRGAFAGANAMSGSQRGTAGSAQFDSSPMGGHARQMPSAVARNAGPSPVGMRGIAGFPLLTPVAARQRAEAWTEMFFQTTHVEAAMREKLLDTVSQSMLDDSEILQTGREQGLSLADISKLRLQNSIKLNKETTDILGSEQGKYFWDVYTSEMFVPLAQEFAARCAAQGSPLSASATAAVAINFAQNLRNPDISQTPTVGANGAPINENTAFQSAAGVLNPTQLDLFKKMWAEHPFPEHPH